MGQARARKKEIAELKRHGRLIDTPRFDRPVMYRVGDAMWIVDNAEFKAWCDQVMTDLDATPVAVQREFARLALIAERSGVKENLCQEWFRTQCNAWADAKLKVPMAIPIIFASSTK